MKCMVLLALTVAVLLFAPGMVGAFSLEGVKASDSLRPPETLTPEFLREACYNYGAVNTVRMLTSSGGEHWHELLRHISAGETGWIIYVPLFISGTEAGQSAQLSIALAEALPKNPYVIISPEYSFVSLRRVCPLPFINPDKAFIQKYTQEVVSAMRDINEPFMKPDKDICLGRFKASAATAQKRLDSARQASTK